MSKPISDGRKPLSELVWNVSSAMPGIAPSSGGMVPLKSFWLSQTLAPSLCVGIVPLMEFPMRENSASAAPTVLSSGGIVPLSLS